MPAAQLQQRHPGATQDALFRTGMGNWDACIIPVPRLLEQAERWRAALVGITHPWLCWNIEPDWCVLQQRLVQKVGWTPVVGFDPRIGAPPLEPGAVLVDFNAGLDLPTMYPHFPIEFMFAFCDRIAFWHSDLLVRLPVMQSIATQFRQLKDGEIAAVPSRGGIRGLVRPWSHRYWELIACTTRGASRDQFEFGAGWWYNFCAHPNFRGKKTLFGQPYYWDHGTGIMYWARNRKRRVHAVPESLVAEGHFTSIGKKNYVRTSPNSHMRNLNTDLRANYDLANCARQLGLEELLTRPMQQRPSDSS